MTRKFVSSSLYVIEGAHANRLDELKARLFTETRMDGDAMRDAAQLIESILRYAEAMGELA
jgi:hypothetical protein